MNNLRVIGARIDVEGAPGRANPSPGDDIEVSILVIDRGAEPTEPPEEPALTPPPLTWAFVACVPTATRIGVPICGTLIEACDGCIGPPPSDPFAFPVIGFQVPSPSEEELDAVEAREVLLQGVVCGEGSPSADAIARFLSGETDDLLPCEGPMGSLSSFAEPLVAGRFVTVQIPIERDPEDPNLNPEILDGISLNGSAWPPPYAEGVPRDAPLTGCKTDLDGLSEEDRAKHPFAGSGPSSINLSVTRESLQFSRSTGSTSPRRSR